VAGIKSPVLLKIAPLISRELAIDTDTPGNIEIIEHLPDGKRTSGNVTDVHRSGRLISRTIRYDPPLQEN
jgi:hypothetical protein